MSKLSKYFRNITAPVSKLCGKGDELVVNSYGGKLLRNREALSSKEFSERLNYNLKVIVDEIWVPDQRFEKLTGCQAIAENVKLPASLSHDDLVYCYQSYKHYLAAINVFGEKYLAEFHQATDTALYNMDCDMAREPDKKKPIDEKLFTMSYIKQVWIQALDESEADLSEMPTSDEELRNSLDGRFDGIRSMFNIFFITTYRPMAYMRMNFYGSEKPLYAIN